MPSACLTACVTAPEPVVQVVPPVEVQAEPQPVVAAAADEAPLSLEDFDEIEEEVFEEEAASEPAGRVAGYASLTAGRSGVPQPLDLSELEVAQDTGAPNQDELLLDSSGLAADDAQVSPLVRKRPAGSGGEGGFGGGATLFERMANLSRGTKSASVSQDDDEDDDAGSSISIPRFLGRQNNQ